MHRKISVILLTTVLLLSGCLPGFKQEDNQVVKEDEKGKEETIKITPEVKTTEEYYRTVVDFEPGAARGHIVAGVGNRLDIDELETGLMRLSKSSFPVDKYIFQPGQFLSSENIETWLENKNIDENDKKKKGGDGSYNPKGLTPKLPKNYQGLSWQKKVEFRENHPSYLSYIVEQNYLVETGEGKYTLGGLSIGISLNKAYYYEIEDKEGKLHRGNVPLDDQRKVLQRGKQLAKVILQRLRKNKKLQDVPIVIGLYQEQELQSMIPGHFMAKTAVDGGKASIDEWNEVEEEYVLFPSDTADDQHKTDAEKFDNFKLEIEKYFSNSGIIGIIGTGFYKNGELQNLKIEIPIKFYAKTEVIAFTQYVAGKVMEKHFPFSRDVSLEVYISSLDQPEAVIVRDPDMDEPVVHIYE